MCTLQGYLAHKKAPPPWTLRWAYAYGPMVILGVGGGFLLGEVPLYRQPPSYPAQWARKGYFSDSDHLSVHYP
jgi:hypothetical protein